MGKHKDSKKKKGSQFAIRVDKDERDAFVSLCEALDTSAAREIRKFMREWVAKNAPVTAEKEKSSSSDPVEASNAPDLSSPPASAEAEGGDAAIRLTQDSDVKTVSEKQKKQKKRTG